MSSDKQSLSLFQKILLAILFLAAGLTRLYDLTDEPLELHPARQMRSAIITRAFFFEGNPEISPEKQAVAAEMLEFMGVIEPPIMESISLVGYRLTGMEIPWVGRLTSIFFWLVGGWAVFRLGDRFGSSWGGIGALTYYLFLPFGMRFSRILLPDPMMVSLSVIGLWLLLEWEDRHKWSWAALTGLVSGLAILVKTVAGLILILPFAVYLLSSRKFKHLIRDIQVWLILLLTILPTAIYYYWGIVIDGRLATQFSGRFFPELWADILLYKSWGLRIIMEFSLPAFVLAMIGIFLAGKPEYRRTLFAWWVGYFGYGMAFTYHIMTHDYYHLPMAPLVAVSIAPVVTVIEKLWQKRQWPEKVLHVLLAAAVFGFGIYGSVTTIRFLQGEDYRLVRAAYEETGQYLEQQDEARVFALTEDYETSFRFYTFRVARHWPHTGDQAYFALQGSEAKGFESLWENAAGFDYFLLEDHKELNRQPMLEEKLNQYPVVFTAGELILYRLGTPEN